MGRGPGIALAEVDFERDGEVGGAFHLLDQEGTDCLDLGRLRASGQWVARSGAFSIAVPGDYVILTEHGVARGMLDGTPCSGPRRLEAGPHQFQPANPDQRAACLWAPAYQRGYSPFHLRDLEF